MRDHERNKPRCAAIEVGQLPGLWRLTQPVPFEPDFDIDRYYGFYFAPDAHAQLPVASASRAYASQAGHVVNA